MNPWTLSATAITLLFSLPITVVLASLLSPFGDAWTHLSETVLPDYISSTFWLVAGVSVGVLSIGVTTAWLLAR